MTTRDEAIKAAREVGIESDGYGHPDGPTWLQLERLYALAYKAGMAAQCQIKIPTNTMEQEFAHYQRDGYKKGYKAGMELAAEICTSQMLMSDRPRNANDCADAIREKAKKCQT